MSKWVRRTNLCECPCQVSLCFYGARQRICCLHFSIEINCKNQDDRPSQVRKLIFSVGYNETIGCIVMFSGPCDGFLLRILGMQTFFKYIIPQMRRTILKSQA